MSEIKAIKVGGVSVGLVGLDEILEEMAPQWAQRDDQAVASELLRRVSTRNYISPNAQADYAVALVREFRRHLGQPYEPAPRQGLEVKVLGPGCPRCHELRERVFRVLTSMGLAVELEEVKDLAEITARGVVVTPALIINDQVVCSGRVPSEAQIKGWLSQAHN